MTEAQYYAQQDREDDLARIHREKMEEVKAEIKADPDYAWEVLTESDFGKLARAEIVRLLWQSEAFKDAVADYAATLADRHCDALEAARKEGDQA